METPVNRTEFERQMAGFRERIAQLPPAEREALEELVRETVQRHEQIQRASLEGHRAAERLELAFGRLGDACRRVRELAAEAQATLTQARTLRRPEAGLN